MNGHAAATVPGATHHSNDDRALTDPRRGLYVVADGIGGVRHGARSAQLVADELAGLLDDAGGDLAAAVRAVHDRLHETSRYWVGGSGTTLVGVHVEPTDGSDGSDGGAGVATVVHVGDSKAYLLRADRLAALTTDHTLAQVMVDSGHLDAASAGRHPGRSRLVRWVGMPGDLVPEVRRVRLRPGDRLLLCSDGLTDARPESELRDVLAAGRPAAETCRWLLEAPATPGDPGHADDATAVVVDVAA